MLIDLSELLPHEGMSRNVSIDIDMDNFETKSYSYKIIDKKPIDFEFTNLGKKKIKFRADTDLTLQMQCDRCLQDVETNIKLNISKEIDMNESGLDTSNDLDGSNFMESAILDVDKLIFGEILLELPMKVLCNEDCQGICNRCGTNLNSENCDCITTELDPRMSKILDVFNENKEV